MNTVGLIDLRRSTYIWHPRSPFPVHRYESEYSFFPEKNPNDPSGPELSDRYPTSREILQQIVATLDD